ncbi:MAG: DUF559 domain-containing protein [Deltaproteobacteria bacterium]
MDGDFWHDREWRRGSRNSSVGANVERDRRKTEALRAMGYDVVRVWETDVVRDPERTADGIATRATLALAARRPRANV